MKNTFLSKSLKITSAVALLLTTGCAEYHKRKLEHMEPKTCSAFLQTLAKEYTTLGRTEQYIMYDEISADYYYRKAICALEGNCVTPTPLCKWDIPELKLAELEAARARLVRALDAGARDKTPKLAAYAQAHFDCWVEQQAENWQKDDIAACRSAFYTSMAEVELLMRGGDLNLQSQDAVFFDFKGTHIDGAGMQSIDRVASRSRAMGRPHHILLVGRTDKVGNEKYNKHLAKRRAKEVKKELIRHGIDPYLITIKVVGESAGQNVDRHNRRVDIIFLD